ncbi:proton-conducting transporter transmembrane domain-containing protein [Wenyingzhuangia marina]|uniref:NAD(P)H-quinone oxidoreductase subunit 5 n=1 Tax=Wenyingzhuangia marina TaxID=1195760 RepID=A0A1M5U5M3_9FLAO|nr:proton-conducting transporter membrane subunit [Wenyingzhuangia marina]GGF69495.1 NADH dehydrogenase [Wenyingzhuangia marina]SHH58228.1 NAD(P)H-quinone oxidoreductase subunit 5 [Wenyingzhuangia marina]
MISKHTQFETTLNIITKIQWLLFIGMLSYLLINYPNIPEWHYGNVLRINGFTLLIWTVVTFFSALISSYGKNYLKGFKYHSKFIALSLGFTLSIMVFVMANHIGGLIVFWMLMGFFMSKLIGINASWGEAKEALKYTLKYFLTGSLFLSIGLILLAFYTKEITLNGIISKVNEIPYYITLISGLCIITAAIIQSAIYPFHRWLLSAMTAPTPASALMHAGFVNGSGILLTLLSPILFASNTLIILFIIGGLTAVIAQFTKLLQVNVKQKLACSTIAQMGFMIMQCGLGFFNAAVVHLILHGFYKAYLFLSSGENIAHSKPQNQSNITIKPLQIIVVLLYSAVGTFLFGYLTGKGIHLNSGLFLTLIVAITVGQVTYNIVKEPSLSVFQKTVLPPVLFISGMVAYALMYNGVTTLMSDMPLVAVPLSVSPIEITFGIIFLIGFFIMKLGIYRNHPWIYAKLLNISQPNKKTVLMYKS